VCCFCPEHGTEYRNNILFMTRGNKWRGGEKGALLLGYARVSKSDDQDTGAQVD
jgi:hypothetical protein